MTPEMQAMLEQEQAAREANATSQPEHVHEQDENCGCSKAVPDAILEQRRLGREMLKQFEEGH